MMMIIIIVIIAMNRERKSRYEEYAKDYLPVFFHFMIPIFSKFVSSLLTRI